MAARGLRLTLALVFLSRVFSENPPLAHDSAGKETKNASVEISRRISDLPNFAEPIQNITVPVGREAVLTCLVEQLGAYKVAWLRVDTQTILTIHGHVITKNHRIGVTHSDRRSWCLHIKEIRESDRGWYMCQINTDPMKSQVGFLDVVVPPDIVDVGTSTDMIVREGANVTFTCSASGSPAPNITWRREAGQTIPTAEGQEAPSIDGVSFNLTRINRLHMGAYLCIASNGWPPSVSKRIMLIVHFPPMIWIQNQLVGAMEGERMTLECLSEAFPKSINYWTRESGDIISQGPKFEPSVVENSYKIQMKLTIHNVALSDFGSYKCVSKNSLGETDGTIKLYQIPTPTTTTTTTLATTMTTEMVIPTTERPRTPKPERKKSKDRKKVVQEVNEIAPIPSDDRRQAVQPGPIKIEENRHETKMDRSSHFPMAHESSASLRCLPQSLLPLQAILLLLLLNSRHLSLPFHR